MDASITHTLVHSPLGTLYLAATEQALVQLSFTADDLPNQKHPHHPVLQKTIAQLQHYFAGNRTEFSIPLAPGGTPFQKQVWHQLQRLNFGTTTSYGAIAATLGDAKKSQAVAKANGQNPIAIIIPCHRVIAADGKLTGYAGGIERKKWLLKHENALLL